MTQPFPATPATASSSDRRAGVVALLVIIVVVFWIAGCQIRNAVGGAPQATDAPASPAASVSIYEKTATLDAADAGRAAPTQAQVSQMREAIIALSARCQGTSTGIADAAHNARGTLVIRGVSESRYDIIRGAAEAIPASAYGDVPCDQAIAAYATARAGD